MISKYFTLFQKLPFFESISKDKPETFNFAGIGNVSAKAFFASALSEKIKNPILWIAEDSSQILEIVSNLHHWSNKKVLPILEDTPEKDIAHILPAILNQKDVIIVTSLDLVKINRLVDPGSFNHSKFVIKEGTVIKLIDLFDNLINLGYEASLGNLDAPGTYLRRGGIIDVFPIGAEAPYRIELFGDKIEQINKIDLKNQKITEKTEIISIFPAKVKKDKVLISEYFRDNIIISDELSLEENERDLKAKHLFNFHPFLGEETFDCGFSAVLRYNSPIGFAHDLKEKLSDNWQVLIFSDDKKVLEKILRENGVHINKNCIILEKKKENAEEKTKYLDSLGFEIFPEGFLNHTLKLKVITDREIFNQPTNRSRKVEVDAAFLANLYPNDFVVHFDHGIGCFRGIQKKNINDVIKEYLFIEYANNDKLFVPVDQADKVNKYIGADGSSPRLTRLGSAEWETMVKRGKEETLQIAKELLQIFAERDQAKGVACKIDNEIQAEFEKKFPYEPTDGQIEAIQDVKRDMESTRPMDRLICGDVGFGKTEVAMRAAFKAVQNGKQVALLTPITILADQHYHTLVRRMKEFSINIEMVSRFRSKKEIAEVLNKLRTGQVDIVIGTHMLLQERIVFKDLGLLIIDEEQRFGVKQKEKLKELRVQVDVLTLTATPIPRTLNMALAGIRDISTITTPPPGRLPIHTEVRRFSLNLIREVILRELERKGQVYFLHNRVQTIESIAEKLRTLIPEARFVVAHGQLNPSELESRILSFKDGKFDVLVSSTIIENGIDLENANTLVVDQAETLGLAQAYQLRGRVGRSKKQAYAYFLYHSQKLRDDAKKRLRAIIEASELGSGFQIAMRDLEIRGAGEILGSKQHGTINSIGVSHFCRLLSKAIEDLKLGKTDLDASEIVPDTKIELSISAFIPDEFIPKAMEKIRYYQRLSGVENIEDLNVLKNEIEDKYGKMPKETLALLDIIKLKLLARNRGIVVIREIEFQKVDSIEIFLGKKVTPKAIMNLLSYNANWRIIESKMTIDKNKLGEDWFKEIYNCIDHLK